MDTDHIIDYRRKLTNFTGIPPLPEPTVYATNEWIAVVQDLAAQIDPGETSLQFPTAADCNWPWLETGVLVVFETPVVLQHLTTSETLLDGKYRVIDPVIEDMTTVSILFTREMLSRTEIQPRKDATVAVEGQKTNAVHLIFIPEPDPATGIMNLSQANFGFGWSITIHPEREFPISGSMRFVYALLSAAGHAMTTHTPLVPANNPARKRYVRTGLPPVRMLELTAPTAEETGGTKVVNWKRSWKVRTHWRNQACGPKMRQHKKILIHSYWKQEHLPPDLRPTVWEAR